jgi:hypothetical protein
VTTRALAAFTVRLAAGLLPLSDAALGLTVSTAAACSAYLFKPIATAAFRVGAGDFSELAFPFFLFLLLPGDASVLVNDQPAGRGSAREQCLTTRAWRL